MSEDQSMTLKDRLIAAGVDLVRDKHEILSLLQMDFCWDANDPEFSHENVAEALEERHWLDVVQITPGYVGLDFWAAQVPVCDAEGFVEERIIKIFPTREAAETYCREAKEAHPQETGDV